MNPSDFFKSLDDVKEDREDELLLHYIERLVTKHFLDCVSKEVLLGTLRDTKIPKKDRPSALREMSEGLLTRVLFHKKDKYGPASFMGKGAKHPMMRLLLSSIKEDDCDIVVFPGLGGGHWVAHALGMSPDAGKTPRIVIPGDGVSLVFQELAAFCREHK